MSETDMVVYGGFAEFKLSGGKTLRVKPLQFGYITSGELEKAYLPFPSDKEELEYYLFLVLSNEAERNKLDNMLKMLVSDNGEPVSLEKISAEGIRQLHGLMEMILRISGLMVKEKDDIGSSGNSSSPDWIDIIAYIQNKAHMTWDEIMAAPLLRLHALKEKHESITINDFLLTKGAGYGFGVVPDNFTDAIMGSTPNLKARAEYDKFFADCRK